MVVVIKHERDVIRLFEANDMAVRSIRRRKHWVVTEATASRGSSSRSARAIGAQGGRSRLRSSGPRRYGHD